MIIPIQWRPKYIEGYEGEYGVVRAGFVFSFKRWKFLAGGTNTQGYKKVELYKKGEKPKTYLVHRLVALAFIPNPNNYPEINHKDEDKTNNAVWNLEWCDRTYNNNYGKHNKRMSKSLKGRHLTNEHKMKISEGVKDTGQPILMFTKEGEFIRRFNSIAEANEFLGKHRNNTNIYKCTQGKYRTVYGYIWKYEE